MPSDPTLLDALLAVQSEAPPLRKTATNPHYRSSYSPLEEIVAAVNPLLQKHKLVWTTKPSFSESAGPTLRYKIAHVPSGQADEGEMPLLLSKQDAQGQGSAITYARRYALCAVLNLVAEDDDDGARASTARAQSSEPNGRPGKPSEKQVELIHKLGKQKSVTVGQLKTMLATIGVEGLEIEEGWVEKLTGGKEGQASALIDLFIKGEIPEMSEKDAPVSDVPEPAQGEFEHAKSSLEGTPFAT